ncbi:hypothetical protein C3920_08140 [Novacetimonas pomaceti]|uniref:Alpha-L-glutamate ligase-related protein ATP-grasp domain-containing protein n=1 Tax=Novacetimonas pomaceti TaxID=2021998 RepID=A0ABX5P3X4_9PROT|nr:hypothetical protein C3920_08140 [Novacetimonas pomaceti]
MKIIIGSPAPVSEIPVISGMFPNLRRGISARRRGVGALLLDFLKKHGEAILYRASGLGIMSGFAINGIRKNLFESRVAGLKNPSSPLDTIRHAYVRHYWRPEEGSEWLDIAVAFMLWLPGIIVLSVISTHRNASYARRHSGRAMPRQFLDQIVIGMTTGILPPWYYIFDLYKKDNRGSCLSYIGRGETKAGAYVVLSDVPRKHCILGNKDIFAAHCREFGLHAVEPVAIADDGHIMFSDTSLTRLPACDLFIKPARGSGGRGAERWRWQGKDMQGQDIYTGTTGRLAEVELRQRLAFRSNGRRTIIQRCLSNHPDIAQLAGHAVATVRMVTCLNEDGMPEITDAIFRMATRPDCIVDNIHAGGIGAPIDISCGQLGCASNLGVDAAHGRLRHHPGTNHVIEGVRLPFWNDVRALACAAHATLTSYVIVGWDIALTTAGPVLIEGNSGPCLDIMQRMADRPLGDGRLAHLLAHHLLQGPQSSIPNARQQCHHAGAMTG